MKQTGVSLYIRSETGVSLYIGAKQAFRFTGKAPVKAPSLEWYETI